MRSYDEITANVLEAAKCRRHKAKQVQYAVSVSAMCLTCMLGLGVYMNLEKPEAQLPSTEISTETTAKATNAAPLPPEASTELQYQITEFSDGLLCPNAGGNVSGSWFATSTVQPETDPVETETPTESQTFAVQTTAFPETTTISLSTDPPESSKTTPKDTSPIATTQHVPSTDNTFTTVVPPTTTVPSASIFTTQEIPATSVTVQDPTELNPEPTDPAPTDDTVSSETTVYATSATETFTTTTTATETIPADTTDNTPPPEPLSPQNLPPNLTLSSDFAEFLLTNLTEEELKQFRQFIEDGDLSSALNYLAEILPLLLIS